jgi:hypothetical protein
MPVGTLRRVIKRPFFFPSEFQTTGDGTLVNGGSIAAGDQRTFPQSDFKNDFTWPVWISKVHCHLSRVGGGNTPDADYAQVYILVKDLVTNEDLFKDVVPLSVLLNKETKIWDLKDGNQEWVLRTQGGGATVRVQVNAGAVGAPYNMEIALEGYSETEAEIPNSFLPDQR